VGRPGAREGIRRAGGGHVSRIYFPAGTLASGGDLLRLTPRVAGWRYAGLRVLQLAPGERAAVAAGGDEYAVLPLSGAAQVEVDGRELPLRHREDVFSDLPDTAYIPRDTAFTVRSERGCRLAMPFCPARTRRKPALLPRETVPVEVRGAGSCTRQVNNFLAPAAAAADRLLAVEVLTPGGNWSSYPPHKHDQERPGEAALEEIYYFEIRHGSPGADAAAGFALQRLYTADGKLQAAEAVRHGDAFCIPRGYHGPSAAAPGYDLYYLNVLAGPAAVRTMAFCDDPSHHWIRESWTGQQPDPRIPLYGRPAGPEPS
jgi:5-deoxy-glucuronate isomerase